MPPKTPRIFKRLFVGIPVSAEIREKTTLLLKELQHTGAELKLASPENLHITLHFLGKMEKGKISLVEQFLSSVTLKSFSAKIRGIDAFPNVANMKVIWAGLESKELQTLTSMVRRLFSAEEIETPHLTLARIKSANTTVEQYIKKHQDFFFGEMLVDKFILYESELTAAGAIYTPLKVFPLL